METHGACEPWDVAIAVCHLRMKFLYHTIALRILEAAFTSVLN